MIHIGTVHPYRAVGTAQNEGDRSRLVWSRQVNKYLKVEMRSGKVGDTSTSRGPTVGLHPEGAWWSKQRLSLLQRVTKRGFHVPL